MPRLLPLTLALLATLPATAPAGLVISQYYEGNQYSRWIELFNSGASAINLSGYAIGVWNDGNATGYKTGAAPTTATALPNYSLPSGGVYLIKHPDAIYPEYAVANSSSSTVLSFDGNDSVGIYTGTTYSVNALVDAIGFTNTVKAGENTGFIRISLDEGFNTLGSKTVLDFTSVWKSVTLGQANLPNGNVDYTLGSTSLVALSAVPEPTAALVGGLVASALSLTVARRPAHRG